jgi:pseudaminic acid synthase
MKIGKHEIGQGHPPYIIAEIGANHGGNLERALRLIESAKAAGADAVKFQAYTADTITIDSQRDEFILKDGPWKGWKLYDLYKRCETPFGWFPRIAQHAKSCRIDWFASAFDESAVDVLDQLDSAAIKIASFEIIDLPLIKYAARTGRPLIISTGMADHEEIHEAVTMARHGFRRNVAVLHCVSGYPTPIDQARLDRYWELRIHNCPFGISDHSTGMEVPVAATALGATIIEKHFKLNDGPHSPDAAFSMEPIPFRKMADACRSIWKAMQPSSIPDSERPLRPLRPSLYAVEFIPAGERFTEQNVRSIRPGAGLPPAMLDEVLKHKAARPIKRGTPLSRDLLG